MGDSFVSWLHHDIATGKVHFVARNDSFAVAGEMDAIAWNAPTSVMSSTSVVFMCIAVGSRMLYAVHL